MTKREERQALLTDLDKAYTNGGFLQFTGTDVVYNLATPEGWAAYEQGCMRVGELADEIVAEGNPIHSAE